MGTTEVQEGMELLMSYGELSNAELVFYAGFALLPNPEDCIITAEADLLTTVLKRQKGKVQLCGSICPGDLKGRCAKLSRSGSALHRLSAAQPLLGGAVPLHVV